ncbi:MAG: NTP transferase domain-containing protein [Thermoleophilaceae bacterium]|nr:NTP transferase domain-containing protein [Thermoleophilaceae bacterium]
MKGLILAARGSDDELTLISGGRAPQTFPVANVPLIHHALYAVSRAGAGEIGIVVSSDTAADVRACAGEGHTYIDAAPEANLVDALLAARDFLGDEPFIVQAGDGLLLDPLEPIVEAYEASGVDAVLLVRPGDEKGVTDIDSKRLLRLVDDKPLPPAEHLLAGVYVFGPEVLEVAGKVAGRGVASVIAALVEAGGSFETRPCGATCWKYAGTSEDLLEANRMVLDEIETETGEADLSRARITGRVSIHPTAILDRATIRGPAVIGPGAVLVDTFVGPYTSIAEGARLEGAELEFSIVLSGATIRHPGKRIEASLVGQEASITRDFALPAAIKLRVGRGAEVSLA